MSTRKCPTTSRCLVVWMMRQDLFAGLFGTKENVRFSARINEIVRGFTSQTRLDVVRSSIPKTSERGVRVSLSSRVQVSTSVLSVGMWQDGVFSSMRKRNARNTFVLLDVASVFPKMRSSFIVVTMYVGLW